ncbi:MAG TPA: signal peptidase II [Anaerolineae bacterium]|nr:signal peptidase II [Anaerolineae bacterium]
MNADRLVYRRRFSVVPLLIGGVVVLDQLTKWLVLTNLAPGQYIYPIPALADLLAITHVTNTGIAFGLFKDANTFLAIIAIVVIVGLVRYVRAMPPERWLARLALALVLGGAIGNLIDRLRLGYVVDFVAVGAFARFNVSDSAISIGIVLLATAFLFDGRRASKDLTALDTAPVEHVEER